MNSDAGADGRDLVVVAAGRAVTWVRAGVEVVGGWIRRLAAGQKLSGPGKSSCPQTSSIVRSVDDDISRPGVLASWRRSEVLRVHPDRVELPYVREPNRGSRLARAAAPVLQRVTEDLAAQAVGVVLTSTDGVVVERTAAQSSILNALDTVRLAPGFSGDGVLINVSTSHTQR